jgi:hypothetical protein
MTPRSGTGRPHIVARGQARCAVNLLLAFSVLSGGCASGASTLTPNRPAISDGNARTALGSVGIATTTRSPILSPHRPGTPTSAAEAGADNGFTPFRLFFDNDRFWAGAGEGAGAGLLIAPVVIAITPFTVSVGAIYGALAGKSSEDTETAVSNLDSAIREGNVQQRLRDIVIARLSREYGAVVPVNDTATAHEDIGTVVEARVNFVYLDGGGSRLNPKLRLSLVGDMRIHRKGKVVSVTSIGSSGAGERYTLENWAADNAQTFKEGMARELASLADDLANKLFAWRNANEPSPAAPEPFKAICPGTSVWERLGLDLVCPPARTDAPLPMKR